MTNTFFEKSKEIANDYIQNIVFLDDRAYKIKDEAKPNNDLDVAKISKHFAKEKKICAVYQPESEQDIEYFKAISNKSDVIVLDWEINFPKDLKPGTEDEDDEDEPRGVYTKSIIQSSLFEDGQTNKSLKMILVYTGDYTILKDILHEIYREVFDSSENYTLDEENLSIKSAEFKILVRSKKIEINNESNKAYEKQMVNYEDLPKFIIEEFTKMTSGLLPNFALLSLSTLRKNSSKILGLFSKEMDSAYMAHKATIPKQEDSEELLVELFGDSVKDLLFYSNINGFVKDKLVDSWIEGNILEEEYIIGQKKLTRSVTLLKELVFSPEENVEERFNSVLGEALSKNEKKGILNNCTVLFINDINHANTENSNKRFSKLAHHKSLFLPKNIEPKLTLGSLLKSTKYDTYYICIQQKCDSVRIPKDAERKFLFIPLKVSTDKFDILTPDGIKLKRFKDSFSIRTIKFICSNDYGMVIAQENENGEYVFQQKYDTSDDEHFIWVLDLKDLHSQRIIIDYTSQLSRVGLNESEWHRKQLS